MKKYEPYYYLLLITVSKKKIDPLLALSSLIILKKDINSEATDINKTRPINCLGIIPRIVEHSIKQEIYRVVESSINTIFNAALGNTVERK